MKIYTRLGDGGTTSLPGDRRESKTDLIFDCLGALDEANAAIGLAVSFVEPSNKELAQQLHHIQSQLLSIGACLASAEPDRGAILKKLDRETEDLEAQIDRWDKQLPVLKNFILPGGTNAGSTLHLCRTIIRRAERAYHRLERRPALIPVGRYLNRLSDYFFQAARFVNHEASYRDQIWTQ